MPWNPGADWYDDRRDRLTAEQEQLARDAVLLFHMPEPFRRLAHELMRAVERDPQALNTVGKVLVDHARASLERRPDDAPKIH